MVDSEDFARIRRENLKKGHKITADNAVEMQKKSAAAKRKRRTIRETMEEVCRAQVDTTSGRIDRMLAMCLGVSNKAIKGDSKAFRAVMDALGETPVRKIATTDTEGNDLLTPIINIRGVKVDDSGEDSGV